MKLVTLSDTHGAQFDIPEGDVLIHAGDLTSHGDPSQVQEGINWLASQPHKHKILIAGNHDFALQNWKQFDFQGIYYLINSFVQIEGVKFYGSPATPKFYNWAFMSPRGAKIRETWKNIPLDTDVLITHGPPHGIGDAVPENGGYRLAGCMELLNRVREVKPVAHIFGHIHEGRGGWFSDEIPTAFFNVAIKDGNYNTAHAPMTIYLDVPKED